jgi:hypothetical protein
VDDPGVLAFDSHGQHFLQKSVSLTQM